MAYGYGKVANQQWCKIEFNTTVDVILQNTNALAANVSEIHPWHLHGHDFWVLGYGEGMYSEDKHGKQLNLKTHH
ncbi:hypothetical protein C5167_001576 [Papaver somniferum]|uniref:Plastocyanin-like domain-containing protein n=1 Tax=Papaver somniferum TaxID=3469 RepID=A0A4Y7KYC7_PAPSO|nr:hypothetical protein C5167_001576 [Papaver somniferum]